MTLDAGLALSEKDFSVHLCHAALNALHDGILLLNSDGRIIYWNDWMEDVSGRPRGSAVGKRLDQVFPEQAGGRLLTAVQWALKNGLPSFLSSSLNRQQLPLASEGRHIEQSIHVTPLNLAPDQSFCLIRVSNVTALVEKENLLRAKAALLKESLAFVETTLLDSPVAMGVYRASGPCIIANEAYASLFGSTRADLQAENFMENYRWQKSGLLDTALAALADGQQHLREIQIVSEAKRQLSLNCLVRVTKLNNENHLLLQILDQTEIRKATEAIRQAKEAAQAATDAKSKFLANMSHEIRTPLNGVLGLAQIGIRDNRGREAAKIFEHIRDSGNHLLAVVNDILDFSKVEAGKLKVEKRTFALFTVIDNVRSFVVDRAEAKGLALSISLASGLPDWMEGDSLRLTQILTNLLSNAIKFTAHGKVLLRVNRAGSDICFQVVDSGIGMSEEQLARLFQPFEQADSSTTRNFGGTGLGLAISRNLANLMGGDIAVESRPGAGSGFTLKLPLTTAAAPAGSHGSVLASTGPRLTALSVLAADDVDINRFILEDLLAYEGARVIFAHDGRQALDLFEERGVSGFDVVLMDVQMPVMDGLEAARRIAAIAPNLPVIGLTAHAMSEEREKCFAAGMVDHVTKPVDIDLLVAAIRRHVPLERQIAPCASTTASGVASNGPLFAGCDDPRVIDLGVLAKRVGNNPAKMVKYATFFIKTTQNTLTEMEAALAAKDMATLSARGHRLTSAAFTVGAMRLGELCRDVECFKVGDELGAARAKFEQLQALFEQIAQRVKDYVQ